MDTDPRYIPEICEDILQLAYCKLPTPNVIWASPPCDQLSRARTRAKHPRNLTLADSLAAKAIEIIKYFQQLSPDLKWFIENGDSTILWGRDVAKDLKTCVILDYCQYNGPGYRKRTRTAHSDNIIWNPRQLCDQKMCGQCVDGKHKLSAQPGPCKGSNKQINRCSLDLLHGLPRELAEEELAVCQGYIWQII